MRPPILCSDVAALTGQLDGLSDPADAAAWLRLLRTLHSVGRRDLPLGRLFEGHVDALQIICRYGSPQQRNAVERFAREGAVFGVWNADLPGDPLRLGDSGLSGGKAFASGAGILTHALVSAAAADGRRQLLLLDLADLPPAIDRSWWRVTG
ncbi:MAG: acyl-CoA dehydrogenase, partial [Methylobacterium mesophilicum]|nr:acyl-CoA dehydrogenase [Methylobacterium mesophilicum]